MTNRFKAKDRQCSNDAVVPLPNPSADTRLLVRAALFDLERIYRPGCYYKKAGVILQGISTGAVKQQSLLTTFGDGQKSEAMMLTLDRLNQQFGAGTLNIAAVGIDKNWTMRRENKTPNYTTQWGELPIAHAN